MKQLKFLSKGTGVVLLMWCATVSFDANAQAFRWGKTICRGVTKTERVISVATVAGLSAISQANRVEQKMTRLTQMQSMPTPILNGRTQIDIKRPSSKISSRLAEIRQNLQKTEILAQPLRPILLEKYLPNKVKNEADSIPVGPTEAADTKRDEKQTEE